jgi:uncharacterized membrane protein YhaH (DUF805 family)
MSFTDAVSSAFRHYADFSGRASRSEYWWFYLFYLLVLSAATLLDSTRTLAGLVALALLLPTLGLAVRRLHDTGHSGWWLLVGFVPLAGAIVLLIFFVQASHPGPNQYGPPPVGTAPPAGAPSY